MSEPIARQRPMIDLDEFERRLRRPLNPPRVGDDPLAELARLVGGEDDPYKAVFDDERQPSHRETHTPAHSAASHGYGGNFAAIEAGLRGSVDPEPHTFADEAENKSGWDVPSPAPEVADTWFGDAKLPPPAAVAPSRSRRPLFLTAAVIGIGVAGIGASFAFKGRVSDPTRVATILAAPGPTKIQPASPGGVDVPNQDASILDKTPQPATVGLADNKEQPVDLARVIRDPAPRAITLGNAPIASDPPPMGAAAVPVPPTPGQMQQPSAGIAALIEPKRVKTVSVRPDGTLLANDAAASAVVPPAPRSTSANNALASGAPAAGAPPAAAAVAKASTPKTTARVVTTPKPPVVAAIQRDDDDAPPPAANKPLQLGSAARTKLVAAKPVRVAEAESEDAPAAASSGGGFAVQLAAPTSEQEAREASARLRKKFSAELAGHSTAIRKAAIGDKEVYRVRVSNLSREDAAALCEKLKAGGGNCFVARN